MHISLWIITAEDRPGLPKGLSTPRDTCQAVGGHVAGASARVLGKCHGMEMARHAGPLGCLPRCSPAVQCNDNRGTSNVWSTCKGSRGEKSHWFCALQVTLAVSVCHRARSLYAVTTGIAQSFVRDKGFPSLSCSLHTCKWLDISLTSGCLVPPFPNCAEDFFSCLQPPRPTLGL